MFLTPEDLARLGPAFPAFLANLVPFMADTGLRIGEVLVLEVADVDLTRCQVRVNKTHSVNRTGASVLNDPKTFRGTRVVPTLTRPVAEALRAQIAERGAGPRDYVFPGPQGGLLSPGNLRKRFWDPGVKSVGLEGRRVTPHALRHTAISRWISAGVADPLQIARWAGHASITTTFDTYGHLFEQDGAKMRAALERMSLGEDDLGP